LLGAPPARFEPVPTGVPAPAEPNRRVSNRKLRALGWEPLYPSYIEGLAASVPGRSGEARGPTDVTPG
jgi:hypothetical protein